MYIFIDNILAPVASALSVAQAKARNNFESYLKSQNLDLYYGYFYMKYFFYSQKCKNLFDMTSL